MSVTVGYITFRNSYHESVFSREIPETKDTCVGRRGGLERSPVGRYCVRTPSFRLLPIKLSDLLKLPIIPNNFEFSVLGSSLQVSSY